MAGPITIPVMVKSDLNFLSVNALHAKRVRSRGRNVLSAGRLERVSGLIKEIITLVTDGPDSSHLRDQPERVTPKGKEVHQGI